MANFIKNKDSAHRDAEYNLIAISNHYGGLGGGHCKFKSYGLAIQKINLLLLQTPHMLKIGMMASGTISMIQACLPLMNHVYA